MSSNSSSSQARSAGKASPVSTKRRTAGVVGAVVGAVVGGVLGAVVVKKVRADGAKSLVPKKVPEVGKRALTAVKDVASDAMVVAKATAGVATDAALSQVKTAAQQFVVDVATGTPPTTPKLVEPELLTPGDRVRKPRSHATSAAKKSPRTARARKTPASSGAKKVKTKAAVSRKR